MNWNVSFNTTQLPDGVSESERVDGWKDLLWDTVYREKVARWYANKVKVINKQLLSMQIKCNVNINLEFTCTCCSMSIVGDALRVWKDMILRWRYSIFCKLVN